jgi:hypothetical protein
MMCFLEAKAMRDLRASGFMQRNETRRAHAGELAEMRALRISVAAR